MLSGADRFIIGICTLLVMLLVALPVAVEAPMFARCTQAGVDILGRADPFDRWPPPWVVAAIDSEMTSSNLPLSAARMSMWNSHCNGANHRTVLRVFETVGLSVWWRLQFSHDDLVGLYASQAWLGVRPPGFSAASRAYFRRPPDALSPEQQHCLLQKWHAPNARAFVCR